MPIELLTERTLLRPFRFTDWPSLQAYLSKPEVTRLDSPYPLDDVGIQAVAKFFEGSEDFLAVCLKETGSLIGHLHFGVRTDASPGFRNLGFVFDSAYWGQGLAHESCQALLRYAFDSLATPGFLTGTRKENLRARRLLGRLGFRELPSDDLEGCIYELDAASHEAAKAAVN
ncbi:MAG: GNAT family N-acetyltransferase [Armatimonadetes bacterium]|nr:GNAT family N-acetyltransferase [Armatimonadota bacterium]